MTWLAKPRLESLDGRHSLPLTAAFADGGYQGRLEGWAAEEQSLELKIVAQATGQHTFVIVSRRWTVERSLAWLMRHRRFRSDYETLAQSSVAWMPTAMIHRMARHLEPVGGV